MKRLFALAAALALLSTSAQAAPRSSANVAVKDSGGVINSAIVYQDKGVMAISVITQGDFVSIKPEDPLVVIDRGAINMPYVETGNRNKGDIIVINPVDDIDLDLGFDFPE